jgi:hypothetical protein
MKKTFEVAMCAFGGTKNGFENLIFRPVTIDIENENENTILNSIYTHGQNDFQPVENMRSVSIGDIIILNGNFYYVAKWGFLNLKDHADFKKGEVIVGMTTYETLSELYTFLVKREKESV